MLQDSNLQLMAMINDLDALISEIDNNPRLSSWVVRLVLKSIKDKAKKAAIETMNPQAYLEDLLNLDAYPN